MLLSPLIAQNNTQHLHDNSTKLKGGVKFSSSLLQLNLFYDIFSFLFAQLLIPAETPLDEDVNFDQLATHEMTGGNIKNAVFRAASRAALRMDGKRNVRMEDLEDAAEEEIGKTSTRTNFRRQDSDAARMYN